jgi:phosphate-selective porin
LAGWHQGLFFLRDPNDNFRLYLQGRLNVDGYAPFGPGVSNLGPGNGLQPTFFLRRARTEISGEILKLFQFKVEGEWGQSTADNANGQAASVACTVDAMGMRTCTERSAPIGTATQRPATQDAFINYRADEVFNVQVGQFKVPFSYENRSSENFSPFMESSLPTRALSAPLVRDIGVMLWGEVGTGLFFYSAGVFNGDGPNRPNADRRFDVMGRAFVRPLSGGNGPLKGLHVGASGRWGRRDASLVGYDLSNMTTQGGFAFWRPTYTDSAGQLTHIMPSGAQRAIAAELFLPISMFDVTSEVVFVSNKSREAADGFQLRGTERRGLVKGLGYYVQLGAWVYGDRAVVGKRGYGTPTQLKLDKPDPAAPPHAVEVLVRFEQLRVNYDGSTRGGADDAMTPSGDIKVNAGGVGVNYWFTKHIRLSANGLVYSFPDSAPSSPSTMGGPVQTSRQRAIAPAQTLAKGVDDSARDTGSVLYEAMVRFGFAL